MRLIPYFRRTEAPVANRWFEEFFSDFPFTGSMLESRESWVPSVDILEKDGNLILRAELPGMTEKDIDLEIEGNTLIPLVNVGFGFGVGSGEGTEPEKGSGHGGGTGGGGGVKPVALIVINDEGVHVESIKSGAASAFEKVAETVGKAAAAKAGETTH